MTVPGILQLGHVDHAPGVPEYTVSITLSRSRSSITRYVTVTEVVAGSKDIWREAWSWNTTFMPVEVLNVACQQLGELITCECEDRYGMQPRLTE